MENKVTLVELEQTEQIILNASRAVRRMIYIVEPQIDPGEIHPASMWKTEDMGDLELVLVNMDISSTDNGNWVSFVIPVDLLNIDDEDELKRKWKEWWESEQVAKFTLFNKRFLKVLKNEKHGRK